MTSVLAFLADNAGGSLGRVAAWFMLSLVVGVGVAALAIVVARRHGWLATSHWPRRAVFFSWALGVPALLSVAGAFMGLGSAVAWVVEHNHLTEKVAAAAVHGVVDVVFADPAARALLDEGRFPIAKTNDLFELLPQTLSQRALQSIEPAVHKKAGDGFVGFVAVRIAHMAAGVVAVSSSAARSLWATPVLHALSAKDREGNADGFASIIEVGDAVVRVHAEPRVCHLVEHVVASQGTPFAFAVPALLLSPVLIERTVVVVRRRRALRAGGSGPVTGGDSV